MKRLEKLALATYRDGAWKRRVVSAYELGLGSFALPKPFLYHSYTIR